MLLCLQVLSHIIEGSGITEFQKLQMQENITTFEDILGGCERLLRTPIPVSYTRHTSRFLIIWLTILPYALWAKLGWATVPAVAMISLLLLGTLPILALCWVLYHLYCRVQMAPGFSHTWCVGYAWCISTYSRPRVTAVSSSQLRWICWISVVHCWNCVPEPFTRAEVRTRYMHVNMLT